MNQPMLTIGWDKLASAVGLAKVCLRAGRPNVDNKLEAIVGELSQRLGGGCLTSMTAA